MKISIIIPCYNCAKTLREAVASCYVQKLDNFEIVMVDDGSADNTKEIMQKLASKHPEIPFNFGEYSVGGGFCIHTETRSL